MSAQGACVLGERRGASGCVAGVGYPDAEGWRRPPRGGRGATSPTSNHLLTFDRPKLKNLKPNFQNFECQS
jgi:hypothetical protein